MIEACHLKIVACVKEGPFFGLKKGMECFIVNILEILVISKKILDQKI